MRSGHVRPYGQRLTGYRASSCVASSACETFSESTEPAHPETLRVSGLSRLQDLFGIDRARSFLAPLPLRVFRPGTRETGVQRHRGQVGRCSGAGRPAPEHGCDSTGRRGRRWRWRGVRRGVAAVLSGMGREGRRATAGRPTKGPSLSGAMVPASWIRSVDHRDGVDFDQVVGG